MLPKWMLKADDYVPPGDGGTFTVRTIKSIGKAMSRIKTQKGHEKSNHMPALLKLVILLCEILLISLSRQPLIIMLLSAGYLLYLCTWPAKDIWEVVKTSTGAGIVAFLLFLPAMLLNPSGAGNNMIVVIKVILSVALVSIFNHTTQWNHITGALRKLHVPGIFIFTLDITLKYIVLLGNLINDLLTSVQLRAVGRNNKKHSSMAGVMGVTFIRGSEMNSKMYEAMKCRGFTDDYN